MKKLIFLFILFSCSEDEPTKCMECITVATSVRDNVELYRYTKQYCDYSQSDILRIQKNGTYIVSVNNGYDTSVKTSCHP